MHGERFHFSSANVSALAIFIMPTNGGMHVGILHRNRDILRMLDLCWHECLRAADCDRDYACTLPALEFEEINDITAMCRLIEQRHQEHSIPYALGYHRSTGFSNQTGELILSDGLGLTCSTFVLKVFESAKVPLIELTNWPMRPDDNVRHASLLHLMENGIPGRLHPAPPEHVQRVREELPCIRLRPEEVAAAALAERLPASFQQVESGGRWILELVTEGAQEAWI